MSQQVLIIPNSQLGMLEAMFKEFSTMELKSKREREAKYRRIVEVLRAFRLIDKKSLVKGLGYGQDSSGVPSAFVIFEGAEHVVGQVGPSS